MPQTLTREETRLLNQETFDKLAGDDPAMHKEAAETLNDFTRLRVREESYLDQILPPETITNDQLDRDTSEGNFRIEEMEPDSPGAISVPLASTPMTLYIRGRKYKIQFDRMKTRRSQKDVSSLRTWRMDIRQVLSDNSIRDLHTERDRKWQLAVNNVLRNAGDVNPMSGVAQHVNIAGGVSREFMKEFLKVTQGTPFSIPTKTVMVNNLTILDYFAFDRLEFGGDLAERVMTSGVSAYTGLAGVNWITSIKRTLIPNNAHFLYPDPAFLGKHYQLEPPTMSVKREDFMLEWYTYEESGAGIGHIGSFGRANATP